jgi:hypothetical protein
MRFYPAACPTCGQPALGTLERITGRAEFDGDPTEGEVQYGGSTEVFWDGQMTVSPGDDDAREMLIADEAAARMDLPEVAGVRRWAVVLLCHEGHDWAAACEEDEAKPGDADAPEVEARA